MQHVCRRTSAEEQLGAILAKLWRRPVSCE